MLICVPDVLSRDEVADFRRVMEAADWEDGRSTAGAQSALVKNNDQLPPNSPAVSQSAVYLRRDTAADISAAVQPLWPWQAFRHPCR